MPVASYSPLRVVGRPADFVRDLFAGALNTKLELHAPDIGGAWSLSAGGPGVCTLTGAGALYNRAGTGAGQATYNNAAAPPSADYSVSVDLAFLSIPANPSRYGVGARWTAAGENYIAYYDTGGGQWSLVKYTAGTIALLGAFADPFPTGLTRNLKLMVRSVAPRQEVLIDGVSRITANDTEHSAAGNAAIYLMAPTGETTAHAIQWSNFHAG